MHSLKTKITLLTVWVIVIAVISVSVLSVIFIRNTEQRKSDQLLLLMCETGARNLDYYFTGVENAVWKVSSFAEKNLSGLDSENLQTHVDRVQPYFDQIANKTNGVLTYYYRIDPAVSDTVKGFWYTNLDGDEFTEHVVTDITLYDTQDTSKLVWFTVPKHEKKAVWLSPYITDNLDVRVISYNVPIYWRGTFVGVIGIEIDYSTMAEQVDSIRLFNNGYAFLNDDEGTLIFHPRIDLAGMPQEEWPKAPEGVIANSTFVRYTFEGVEREAAWLKLQNGMRLNVSVPVREAEGDWESLIRHILLVSAAVLVVMSLGTFFFAARITRPLQQLTVAAGRLEQGNYDFTLDYDKDDEIGRLTRTFRKLARHMQEHITDLNRRANVDALTSVRNKGAFTAFLDTLQAGLSENPENAHLAISVFDCDDLKSINDQYGHDHGDVYLKTASRLICRVFQHSPVFRIGGDEFAVIFRNEDFRHRNQLIDTFHREAETISASAENPWERISCSVGIAEYDPAVDQSLMDTFHRADTEMYTEKRRRKEGRKA